MKHKTKTLIRITLIIGLSGIITMTLMGMKPEVEKKIESTNVPMVPVLTLENADQQIRIPVLGKVSALRKIDVCAEVSGILEESSFAFLEGIEFKKGDTLLVINADESNATLQSQKSTLRTLIAQVLPDLKFDYPKSYTRWNDYLSNFDISTPLAPLPQALNDQETIYISAKNIPQTYFSIKSLETRQAKYIIKAPFDGVLIAADVKPGSLIMNGQKLGTFIDPQVYDLEVRMSPSDIDYISLGDKVIASLANTRLEGRVSRINKSIDQRTQTMGVFIRIQSDHIFEGQYLSAEILSSQNVNGVSVPRKYIIDDHFIYEVDKGIVYKSPVNIIYKSGSQILLDGLKDMTQIITKTDNVYDGLAVAVKEITKF